jgi:hypothetical protein
MSLGRGWLLGAVAVVLGVSGTSAQTPAALVDRAVQAYDDLDFGTSAGLIRRALVVTGQEGLTEQDRLRALSYLGAAELFRDNRDSGMSAFRQIVTLNPRYQIDEFVFPPEVTSIFALVRRDTKVVAVVAPAAARIRAGRGRYVPQLFASSYHEILASVTQSDGRPVRVLYSGLIGDSLEVVWDGLDSTGAAVRAGRYSLTVESTGRGGGIVRQVRVPLEILTTFGDTLPLPGPLPDSLLLREREGGGAGLKALLTGVIGGVGVALLPSSVAPGSELSAGRFAVGGAMTVAGVIGFFTQRGGQRVPENIAANERVRRDWQARVDALVRENETRRTQVDLDIRAGAPVAVDLAGQ